MKYRLANQSEITRLSNLSGVAMRWPVVVAENEGKISGFMGTENRDDAIVGGPIIAGAGITALRIINFYESVLTGLGIKVYVFSVKRSFTQWIMAIIKTNRASVLDVNDERVWFRRELNGT